MTQEVVPVATGSSVRLQIGVLWLDPVEGDWRDVLVVMRHPVVGLLFLLLLGIIWYANATPQAAEVPILTRLVIYGFSAPVATAVVLGWMALRFHLAGRGHGRGHGRGLGRGQINLTLPVLLAVSAVVPVNEVLQEALIGQPFPPPLYLLYMIIFYAVLALALTAGIVAFLAPRLIAAPQDGAGTAPQAGGDVGLAGRRVPAQDIVMLEAQRNRVILVRLSGRDTLPGPLADRIAELPPGLGRLVHRSVWVSEAAVTGHRRDGRDIVITLAGGHSTVAAASRHAEVLPWLQALARQRAGRGQPDEAQDSDRMAG